MVNSGFAKESPAAPNGFNRLPVAPFSNCNGGNPAMRNCAPGWGRATETSRNEVRISSLWPSSNCRLSARKAAACSQILTTLLGSICQVTAAGSGGWIPWKFRTAADVTTKSGWPGNTSAACRTRAQANRSGWSEPITTPFNEPPRRTAESARQVPLGTRANSAASQRTT